MKIISIEGNIGSGKSTFVKELKQNLNNIDKILFLDEPVDIWNEIKDNKGKTIIENYYNNQKKYAFPFQMMAYISRLSILKKAIESDKYDIIITERCIYTDKYVFTKMLYENKILNEIEYTIYNKWFDEFNLNYDIEYIYLKTEPKVSYERVIQRNRPGEIIDISYLHECEHYHNLWLTEQSNVTILNANKVKNKELIEEWMEIVYKLIHVNHQNDKTR